MFGMVVCLRYIGFCEKRTQRLSIIRSYRFFDHSRNNNLAMRSFAYRRKYKVGHRRDVISEKNDGRRGI